MRRLLATTFTLVFTITFTIVCASGADSAVRQEEQPRVVNSYKPRYPPTMQAGRLEGVVNVDVEIDPEGGVTAAKADEALHPVLRKAAEDAARRWTFARSASEGDVRRARLTFEFRLALARAGEQAQTASPYHVVIQRTKIDTVSRVPPDADNMSCELHGFKLERDKVRIAYGLAITDTSYEAAARTLFPRAQTEWEGGCVVSEESPDYAEVLYCAACRAAQKEWLLAQRAPKGGN